MASSSIAIASGRILKGTARAVTRVNATIAALLYIERKRLRHDGYIQIWTRA
ncbi:hypothetical protein HMPREF0758_4359 [Serratia odorifera DSM 4582]|uniref:Uncharacterized protein n=1 Tax=Serratia odorifera DSM 4582 TaxID=667129 RepID=D4E859_SEROD|nr:hypothetical protein HMPREF0758_4359 [Serratia odorifera DSM 4582]